MALVGRVVGPLLALVAVGTVVVLGKPGERELGMADLDVCRALGHSAERARGEFATAQGEYDRLARLPAPQREVRVAERAMVEAALDVTTATYAEAACHNSRGDDPRKACVAVELELNRRLDELGWLRELDRIAAEDAGS